MQRGERISELREIAFWVHLKVQQWCEGEDGATAVEYALMIGLIAVAIIATVALMGDQLSVLFDHVADELADVATGPGTE